MSSVAAQSPRDEPERRRLPESAAAGRPDEAAGPVGGGPAPGGAGERLLDALQRGEQSGEA